jgi:hypothetical protein
LIFETYYDQCKKDKQERWSPKPEIMFVDYIAVVKESYNTPNMHIDLLSYRPIGIWFEKMVNLIAGNTIEYHEFERGLINSRSIKLMESEHCASNGGHTVCDLLAYLTNKYNCSIYLFSDCELHGNRLISAFKDYFDPSEYIPICFETQSFARDASLRNLGTVQEFNWKDKEVGSGDNYETCYLLDGNDVIISDTYDEDNDNSNT